MSRKKPIGTGLKELLGDNSIEEIIEYPESSYEAELKSRIDSLFKEGVRYLKEGDYMEAFSNFKAILLIDENNLKAINNLAISYYNLGKVEKAAELFNRILTLDPYNKSARENLEILEEELRQRNNEKSDNRN